MKEKRTFDSMSAINEPLTCPVYELDSVNEEILESLIFQLGLKKHSKTAMEPCCVICRQNAFLDKQEMTKHSHAAGSPESATESQFPNILS